MRVPNHVHASQPWLIHRLAPDFELLDVWALPVEGAREEFPAFLEAMAGLDPADASLATRVLFWARLRLGGWLGWDDAGAAGTILGSADTTLAARVPGELRGSAQRLMLGEALRAKAGGFSPLYLTDTEWAAELSNATVHGVLHLAWVEQADGGHRGRLAVYVKPRGRLGEAYLRLIGPFRHLVVYPALMRQIGRAWAARPATRPRSPGG